MPRKCSGLSLWLVTGCVAASIFMMLLPASAEEADADAYSPTLGPLEVRVADNLVLHDANRDKDLELRVYYPAEGAPAEGDPASGAPASGAPADGRPYPVILFSHGMGDSKNTAPRLLRYWCSHGYVCIAPTHAAKHLHHMPFSIVRTYREVKMRSNEGPDSWNDRVLDIKLVADSLSTLEELVPDLKGRMDANRMAIGGHSLGACTAYVAGGATVYREDGRALDHADDRMRAVLVLTGTGRDGIGLTEKSWNTMTRPMMMVIGSKDADRRTPKGPLWRAEPYRFAPPGDRYLLLIMGATHMTYIGPLTDDKDERPKHHGPIFKFNELRGKFKGRPHKSVMFDCVKCASLAFWDAYLKDGEAAERAKVYLASDALQDFSNGWVMLDRK